MRFMAVSQLMLTLVVKQQIKILVKSKSAGNSPQIFPNQRLSRSDKDIFFIRKKPYEPALGWRSADFLQGFLFLKISMRRMRLDIRWRANKSNNNQSSRHAISQFQCEQIRRIFDSRTIL
jgi:hypothetical protein